MKLLFSQFGVSRTLGSAILSIALLSAFLALAMSPRVTNTNLGSTGRAVATPACTAKAIFSASFTGGQDASPAVVQQWEAFIDSLVPADYDTVTISGSNDTTGRTLTDATIVPQIATAMKNHTGGTWAAGGFVWSVGIGCSQADADPDAVELNANSIADGAHVCACPNPGYVVRPDIGPNNSSWGGVNTATCGGPSQTITVSFSGPGAPSCAAAPAGMISWWKGQGNANDSQDDNNGTLKN